LTISKNTFCDFILFASGKKKKFKKMIANIRGSVSGYGMMKKCLVLTLLIMIWAPSYAHAEQPIDVLKKVLDQGLNILNNPKYKNTSQKEAQRQELWQVLEKVFDFSQFSKLVLARNWRRFSPSQRKEFIKVFSEFLDKFYLSKLQNKYNHETVTLIDQKMLTDTIAVVQAKVLWQNQEVQVDIKMLKVDNTWKAYDLSVAGVSAVQNYRSQFEDLLRTETPAQVIDLLKEKTAHIKSES
jgi:phospholipid transport system substrate-binding protein